LVGADGLCREIPAKLYDDMRFVEAALLQGLAVQVSPYRPELPIDEAADAIGMARDNLRAYVAEGAIPFRSSEYVDWVQLADVIAWDNKRRAKRSAVLQELLDEAPWDQLDADGRTS
jgi:hypothetical protein